ncbi:uncharacterized protein LOC110853337 isoform X2 [Folsomia candida]|uniref:uncharacterized protein LOC110853337 isoform X2 n=1 Tax=Folsomia candida TaxID=158441 RepID=UPI000B8F2671|nr:uncharacterized protein LOC110853337 isoform X2 [Folsomia candida]
MPPQSKSVVAGSKGKKKFKRTFKLASEFQEVLLSSQLANEKGGGSTLRDTRLACSDGSIDVHATFLGAVSPFFAKCLESQGDSYLSRRNIILPDWTLAEIKPMIQLLYAGEVKVVSEEDVDKLRGLLASFEINIQEDLTTKKAAVTTASKYVEIRCNNTNSITKTKKKKKKKKTTNNIENEQPIAKITPTDTTSTTLTQSDKLSTVSTQVIITTSRRGRRIEKRKYNDSDWEPDTDDENGSKRKKPDNNRTTTTNYSRTSSTSKLTRTTRNSSESRVSTSVESSQSPSVPQVDTLNDQSSDKVKPIDGKADKQATKVDEWSEPDYTDKAWFAHQAKSCQECDKVHDGPATASLCITGHAKLRCYFCFKVCNNTEHLFEHYRAHHKQAGRDACLLCPYCDQTIPFKSVSSHVISLHLHDPTVTQTTANDTAPATSNTNTPNVTPTTTGENTTPSPAISTPASKASPIVRLPPPKSRGPMRPVITNPTKPLIVSLPKNLEKDKNAHFPTLVRNKTLSRMDADGKIYRNKVDITVRRKGLDGKIWVWRVAKN